MILIRPCSLPLCNIQMLVEDYSNAVYWRIAALFSTIAALFSAAVVLWFLIFRQNPNMPDETDSGEKIRFINDFDKEKHHLLSEIIRTLKSSPYKFWRKNNLLSNTKCDKSPNFLHRLAYFFFGSSDSSQNLADLEKLDLSENNLEGFILLYILSRFEVN
jgi:hypothetical protein